MALFSPLALFWHREIMQLQLQPCTWPWALPRPWKIDPKENTSDFGGQLFGTSMKIGPKKQTKTYDFWGQLCGKSRKVGPKKMRAKLAKVFDEELL